MVLQHDYLEFLFGELAYELSVPTQYASSLVSCLMEVGKNEKIVPYGTEALGL